MISFKKALRNSSYLLGFRILSRILSFVFLIYAASRLSPESFGALSFTLVTLELIVTLGDLGITRYGARELVLHWDDRAALIGRIFSVQVFTSLLMAAAGLLIVVAFDPTAVKLQLLSLALASFFFYSFINTTESAFIASEKFFFSALFSFIGRLAYTVFGLAVIATGGSIVLVMWGFLLSVIIESILRITVMRRSVSSFSLRFPSAELWAMLHRCFPFAVAAFASVLTFRGNLIILELLRGDADVGIFNVAFTIYSPFIQVAIIFSSTLYPGLTAAFKSNPDGARHSCRQWYRLIALASLPAAVTVSLLAGVIGGRFPAGYVDIEPILVILMWTVPLILAIDVDFNILQVNGLESVAARSVIIGAVACPLLSLALIPSFGGSGAAMALMLATIIREVYGRYQVRKNALTGAVAGLFVRPVLAAAVMGAVGILALRVNPWFAASLALAVFAVMVFAIKAVSPAEIKAMFLKPAPAGFNGVGNKHRKV